MQYLILCYGIKIAEERRKIKWRRKEEEEEEEEDEEEEEEEEEKEEGFTFHLSIPDSLIHDLCTHKTLNIVFLVP